MRRIRWFGAKWQGSLRTLAAKMKACAFTADSADGFLLERTRDQLLHGSYVEKCSFQEKVTDPFGHEERFDRVTYQQVRFGLYVEFPNLELWDSPRNTQGFISKLLQVTDFSLTIVPLSVDIVRWIDVFQYQSGRRVLIDSLQISDMELAPGVRATMSIRGNRDVRGALDEIAQSRRYVLNRVQIKILDPGRTMPIIMSSTGSIRLRHEDFDDVYAALKSALKMTIETSGTT